MTLTKGKSCTLFGAYWLGSSELFTSVCIKPYTSPCFAARYYYQAMVCTVISPVSTSLQQPLNQTSWMELIQLISAITILSASFLRFISIIHFNHMNDASTIHLPQIPSLAYYIPLNIKYSCSPICLLCHHSTSASTK